MAYPKELTLSSKKVRLPIFLPDATKGVIKSLDTLDLKTCKVEGLMVNTFHLMMTPGSSVIKSVGGIKSFMNWEGLIVSDSGGFQLLSILYRDRSFGTVSDDGITLYLRSNRNKKKFSPEKCIQIQFNLSSDIIICLDDCPPVKAGQEEVKVSVKRTIRWAERCKIEYLRQLETRKPKERPLLFAVIQGGSDKSLRRECAEELLKIGFDGYCFGGWPLDEDGKVDIDILQYVAELIPNEFPKFALGVGNAKAIIDCFKLGYNIFDCVLPTRDARHQRIYILSDEISPENILKLESPVDYMYIQDEKYTRDPTPISDSCDCHTCRNYSRAYLKHLFEIGETLSWRLATIHNLRTYTRLIDILRNCSVD